jgi:hypothetical protein
MRAKPILCTLVLLAAAYIAYPYLALYRLQAAIANGDTARLAALVDWDQVRQGLKDDIAEQLVQEPVDPPELAEQPVARTQNAVAALPPFGSSFIKGIASKAVDETVTPDALARMARPVDEAEATEPDPVNAGSLRDARVSWAFFESPDTFMLWLHTPAGGKQPLKLRMGLRDGAWKVIRIWLPPALLRHRG